MQMGYSVLVGYYWRAQSNPSWSASTVWLLVGGDAELSLAQSTYLNEFILPVQIMHVSNGKRVDTTRM